MSNRSIKGGAWHLLIYILGILLNVTGSAFAYACILAGNILTKVGESALKALNHD